MMEWFRNKKRRIAAATAAGILMTFCLGSRDLPEIVEARLRNDSQYLTAWWGMMYPEFCFAGGICEKEGEGQSKHAGISGKPLKISFWLAKAFDW